MKGSRALFVVPCLLFLLLVSCVSPTSTTVLDQSRVRQPSVVPDKIVIYRNAAQVPGKYEEIALLNTSMDSTWSRPDAMYTSMREEAAKVGANAIILDSESEPSAGAKIAGAFLGTGAKRTGKAVAIYIYPDAQK